MIHHRFSSLGLGVTAFLLAVVLAACGGGSSTKSSGVASLATGNSSGAASTKKATTSAADSRKQLLAYAACMRTNGVDFPDPQFDANGRPQFNRANGQGFDSLRDSPAFAKAQTACRAKRPDFGGQFQRTPAEQAAMRKNLLKFAQCMRSKGIDFPDPTFDANGRPQFTRDGAGGAQGQNRDDTASQAARTACQTEVGGGFGGRGFGPPGGGGTGGAPPSNGGSAPAASSN